MTKEQAIKLLRKDTSPMEIHLLELEGLSYDEVTDKIQEACDMGADAIEKQIPKQLHRYANGTEHCPNCDENLTGLGFKRCIECGQLLTWEGGVEHE